MRNVCRGQHPVCDRVAAVIELIISCNPQGFNILMGKVAPPSPQVIHAMFNSVRVPMPDDFKPTAPSPETEAERIVYDTEYFEQIIKMAGGWGHIAEVAEAFRKSLPRVWAVVIDYEKFVASPMERYGSKLALVANLHGIGVNTVLRYRRNFAYKMADLCLKPTVDNFELSNVPKYKDI